MFTYLNIFGKTIPIYGLTAAAGLTAAVFYMKILVRKEQFSDLDRYLELALVYALTGTAIGAKLLYLIIEYRHIIKDVSHFGLTRTFYGYLAGGFVFYGGMIGCFAALYLFCRSEKISFSHLLQLMLPAFPLAHAIGRIGCYMTGCCYGAETHGALHVIYQNSQFAPNGVPLVPVQLIEAVIELVLFFILHKDSKENVEGSVMLCKYLVLYGVCRFILEFFRGDEYRGSVAGLSTSQAISIVMIIAAAIYAIYIEPNRIKSGV